MSDMLELNDVVKAYLAGCMDCDGCFQVKLKKWNGYSHHVARVSFWQTKSEVVSIFSELYGGTVRLVKKAVPNKDIYSWDATSSIAAALCRDILPFLILKKRQAELLIELHNTKSKSFSGTGVPSDVLLHRQNIMDEVSLLNQKGK